MKVKRQNREKGSQLVEGAIVLPIMVALLAAIAEFGSYFYNYTTLAKATRAGARYLSSKPFTTTEMNRAKNLMICGNPSEQPNGCNSSTSILPGFSASKIKISTAGGTADLPDTITVSIDGYDYNSIFNLNTVAKTSSPWIKVPLKPSTTMRYLLEN